MSTQDILVHTEAGVAAAVTTVAPVGPGGRSSSVQCWVGVVVGTGRADSVKGRATIAPA